MKRLLLLLTVLLLGPSLMASHILGGEIVARCIDDPGTTKLEYEVEVVIYQDVTGSSSSIVVNHSSAVSNTDYTAFSSGGSEVLDTRSGPVYVIRYYATVLLDPNQLNTLSYQVCCRPVGVSNVGFGGSSSSFYGYYFSTQVHTDVSPCNNTPEFVSLPVVSFPGEGWYSMRVVGYDLEGDSLHYSEGVLYELDTVPVAMDTASFFHAVSSDGWMQYGTGVGVGDVDALAFDIESYTNGQLSAVVHREMLNWSVNTPSNMLKVIPSLPFHNLHHDWKVASPDSVLIQASAGTNIVFDFSVPRGVDRNKISLSSRYNSVGDSVRVYVKYAPSVSDVGFEFPIVVRFKASDVLWDEVIYANAIDDIGISDVHRSQVMLYPNPTSSGAFNVKFHKPISSIRIVNLNGQVVYEEEFHTLIQDWSYDERLLPGTYFVHVGSEFRDVEIKVLIVQ